MTKPPRLHRLGEHALAWLDDGGRWEHGNSGVVVDGGLGLLVNAQHDRPRTERVLAAVAEALPDVHIGRFVVTDAAAHRHGGHEALAGAKAHVSTGTADELARRDAAPELAALLAEADPTSPLGRLLRKRLGDLDLDVPRFAPTGSFQDHTTVKLGTVPVELVAFGPAHSESDAVVWLPDDAVLFTGDLLCPGVHPAQWSGSTANWRAVCAELLAMRPSAVVPGRGPVTGIIGIIDFRDYLDHLLTETRARYDRGMPAEEAAVDLPLRHWADWECPENLAVTVLHLYREFAGSGTVDTVPALTLAAEIAEGLRRKPRISPLAPGDRDQSTEDRLALSSGETAIWDEHRENVPNILMTLVRHPHLYEQTIPIARGVVSGVLPPREREIVILRGAWNCTAPYQWNHHLPIALGVGLSEAEIDALSHPVAAGSWSPKERALILAIDELHDLSTVQDETWLGVAGFYSPVELIELVTLCGEYHKISFQVNSWGMPLESWVGPYRLPSGWPRG